MGVGWSKCRGTVGLAFDGTTAILSSSGRRDEREASPVVDAQLIVIAPRGAGEV